MVLFCLLFHLALAVLCVRAGLYPTLPVLSTVYTSGRPARISWIEDGTLPLLSSLGKIKVDLYASNSTYIATLAKSLDPLVLHTTLFLPSLIPTNLHTYTLRFIPSPPNSVIYSADFTIISKHPNGGIPIAKAAGSGTLSVPPTVSPIPINGLGVAIGPTGVGGRPLGIGAPPRLNPTLSSTLFAQGGFVTSTSSQPGFLFPFQTNVNGAQATAIQTGGVGSAIGTNGGDVGDLASLNANGSVKVGSTRQKSDAYVETSRGNRDVWMLTLWVGVGVGWGLVLGFV